MGGVRRGRTHSPSSGGALEGLGGDPSSSQGWRGWVEPPPPCSSLALPAGATLGGRLFIYLYLILYILDGAGGGALCALLG